MDGAHAVAIADDYKDIKRRLDANDGRQSISSCRHPAEVTPRLIRWTDAGDSIGVWVDFPLVKWDFPADGQ